MQVNQAIGIWKSVICVVSLVTLLILGGCKNLNSPVIQQLLVDFQGRGVNFKPSSPFYGTISAVFPPNLYPLSFLAYERRSDEGKLFDTLLLHVTQNVTQTQEVKSNIQAYADDIFGLGGLDLAGPLRYYQCDKLIVVYQGLWESGIDQVVDEVLTEKCESAFVRYPPE